MAGHLLKTVNPEAADAIGKEDTPSVLPPIGASVRYYPRPMEGRGGRTVFFMLVTEHTEDGRVGGVGIFDAQDFRDIRPCWQRTDANPAPAWDWLDTRPPGAAEPLAGAITPPTARVMAEKIASLTHEVAALQSNLAKAFGELLELRQAGAGHQPVGPTKKQHDALFKRVDELELANSDQQAWIAGFAKGTQERIAKLEVEFGIAPPDEAKSTGGKRK
jgi:hypothetical protein